MEQNFYSRHGTLTMMGEVPHWPVSIGGLRVDTPVKLVTHEGRVVTGRGSTNALPMPVIRDERFVHVLPGGRGEIYGNRVSVDYLLSYNSKLKKLLKEWENAEHY